MKSCTGLKTLTFTKAYSPDAQRSPSRQFLSTVPGALEPQDCSQNVVSGDLNNTVGMLAHDRFWTEPDTVPRKVNHVEVIGTITNRHRRLQRHVLFPRPLTQHFYLSGSIYHTAGYLACQFALCNL